MAQTSVEWLLQYLNNVKPNEFCSIEKIKELLEQAKEMEKKQIIDAYNEAYYGDKYKWKGSEEYFNQTFNK